MHDYEVRWKRRAQNKKKPHCTTQSENIRLRYDKSMFEGGVGVTLGVKVVPDIATGRWDASSVVDVILEKTSECFYRLGRRSGVQKY